MCREPGGTTSDQKKKECFHGVVHYSFLMMQSGLVGSLLGDVAMSCTVRICGAQRGAGVPGLLRECSVMSPHVFLQVRLGRVSN